MKKMLMAVVAVACMAVSSWASEFRVVGARAMSMGGAGVARPDGAYAVYYNPAALGSLPDKTEIGVCGGLSARDTGIADHLSTLMERDWNAAIANPLGPDAIAIIDEMLNFGSDDGIIFTVNGALGVRINSMGAGFYPGVDIVVYSELDLTHINPTDLSDPLSFARNTSALYAQGLGTIEFPVGYGHKFDLEGGSSLSVGGAAKLVYGITYDARANSLTLSTDAIQDMLQNADKTAMSFGADLGAQFQGMNDRLSVGLVAKNILQPTFKTQTGADFKQDLQIRGGVAYSLTEKLYAAADIDITENKALITGYKSRQIGAGLSYNVTEGIALRGGAQKNLGASGSPILFSLGASLGTENFQVEAAGVLAGNWKKVQDVSFPNDGGFMLGMNLKW